ncbi:cyclic GMP-AMP synthase-like receptor 2 [Argopecten irradians]|uniref:cyclic GMP-AMP synthase-like receptor 2 n=1 Tax=Argopecten irradians TaxID=31199 RepID=UPI00371D5789
MPPILSKETEHNFNRVCEDYLHILDSYQQGLYNVRIIHHVIWRALRPSSIVLHHRAGSRVERQLRMLQSNGSSDVDYKFEVSGIQVDVSKSNSPNMYFKASCECSDAKNAYGILYVPSSLKTALLSNDEYKRIFNDTFRISSDSKAEFILRPDIFKENVVGECGFQIKRGNQKKTSPSIAVKGAKNETDAVPCLKLNNWTNDALLWVTRDPVFPMFNIKWKQRIVDKMSLYVVPTGNKRSQQFEIEWRLSFVFVEKACFDRIAEYKPRIRHLFGLAKFIFKCCLEELDIFSSYHLKTVLFWKCETKPAESWDSIKPLSFILELISSLETCLDTTTIKHFFIPDCNIFPFDKLDENSVGEIRRRFASVKEVMMERIMTTIAFDLKVNGTLEMSEWIREIDTILKTRKEQGIDEGYISGYLTRLHSMIVHSLLENHRAGTLKESVNALQNILLEERDGSSLCDELVERMIPMLAPSIHTLSEKNIYKFRILSVSEMHREGIVI